MFNILVLVLTALSFGFTWACVIVGLHSMFEVSKLSEEQHKNMFDLHIRA